VEDTKKLFQNILTVTWYWYVLCSKIDCQR